MADLRGERKIILETLEKLVTEDSSNSVAVAKILLNRSRIEKDKGLSLDDIWRAERYLKLAEERNNYVIVDILNVYKLLVDIKKSYALPTKTEEQKVEKYQLQIAPLYKKLVYKFRRSYKKLVYIITKPFKKRIQYCDKDG